jgi:hypothetical protein
MPAYRKRWLAAAIFVTAMKAAAALADDGTFALVSDIHFDPFDPPGLARTLATVPPADWMERFAALPDAPASQYGTDTNHVLLASALAAIGRQSADADFAIFSGDLLSHDFEDDAATALGVARGSDELKDFAARTSIFVADSLAAALPGKPVIVALGNNDSACDDYEVDPGGGYLAGLRDTVRQLAGPDRVAADFTETYAAGGYYAVRHPTVADTLIVVLNDVLWSQRYQDACGSNGLAAGKAEMDWLAATFAAQQAAGGRVWLVQHIPWGIDPWSTTHSKAATCRERVVPFLKPDFAEAFHTLIRTHAGIIDLSLAGHIHTDDYRLVFDAAGNPVAASKVAPAISPVFGQNPAFQVFTYDRTSGLPRDFTTIALANLPSLSPANADWREEYAFADAYGLPDYSTGSVTKLWNGLGQGGRIRDAYLANYNAGHGPLPAGDVDGYACAIAHLDPGSYSACYCGE